MRRRRISNILIIAGLLLLLIPVGGKEYVHLRQQRMLREYQEQLAVSLNEINDSFAAEVTTAGALAGPEAGTEDEEPGESADGASQQRVQGEKAAEKAMGLIKIPCIGVELPILEGSSSAELKWGAGHLTGTALPGQPGNCAIAGHRNYTFGSYFSRLDEVKEGDSVTVEYQRSRYTYTVEKTFLVLPDDVSVLEQKTDETVLTLITCAPKGGNTHRLIVQAVLSNTQTL